MRRAPRYFVLLRYLLYSRSVGLNPEQAYLKRHSQEEKVALSSSEEAILMTPKLKQEYLDPLSDDRPDPQFFEDVYSKQAIEGDLIELKTLRDSYRYKEEHLFRADLAEALVYYLINHGVLGERIEAFPASDFDDIKNGVDLIIELNAPDGKKSRILVDVAVGSGSHNIQEKKRKLRAALSHGKLGEVKYFQSEPDVKGGIWAPKVIIPIGHNMLKQLADGLVKRDLDRESFRTQLVEFIISELDEGAKVISEAPISDLRRKSSIGRQYQDAKQALLSLTHAEF